MQLTLPQAELERIGRKIEELYGAALSDHQRRMIRFRKYYRLWRNLQDAPRAGDEDASNYQVPLLQWQVFGKWADLMHAWLGKGAEVVAEPTGPYDQKIVAKVSLMMTWRVFSYMKIIREASIVTFRAIINGRSHVYMPWEQDVDKGGKIWYDGPRYLAIWPDDLIVPAEDVRDIHGFTWIVHKERLSAQQLLDGERKEKYFGIENDFENILKGATNARDRQQYADELKDDKDEAEGVTHDYSQSSGLCHTILHWYGRRRLPSGKKDAEEDAVKGRDLDESEIVVHYALEMHRVIGVQSLDDLYPKARFKRPFGEIALNEDGSYWTMGFGEMLERIGEELTVNHNLMTDAGEFSVGPIIFASPAAGINAKNFRYEPRTIIETEDPAKINVVQVKADLSYPITKDHMMVAIAERVTGQSDQAQGRASDRPNAPKTATGQVLLAEFGNMRASLDTMFFRECLEAHLSHLWCMEQQFAPKDLFFRVTEEDAPGVDVRNGFGSMETDDYIGEYDFKLKFAPSPWMKQAQEQKQLSLYQLDLTNPLIMQNPRALWVVTNNLHKAMGDDNFADVIPMPEDFGIPIDPKREFVMMCQGDLPEVNPLDPDDLHIAAHTRQLQVAQADGKQASDPAMLALKAHLQKHIEQRGQKQLMHAMVSQLAGSLGDVMAQTAGPVPPGGAPQPQQQPQQGQGPGLEQVLAGMGGA